MAERRASGVDSFFQITARGSTVWRELRGGAVTFLVTSHVIFLVPLILASAHDVEYRFLGDVAGNQPSPHAVAVGVALVAGVLTILAGLFGNYPMAITTSLGTSTFVAFTVAAQVTWADAMGLVVLEGLILFVLVLSGLRSSLFRAVPPALTAAFSAGIGLLLVLTGLVQSGFLRRATDPEDSYPPLRHLDLTPLRTGDAGNLDGWPVLVFLVGLGIVVVLWAWRVPGALLIGIVATTAVGIAVEALVGVGRLTEDNPHGWFISTNTLPDRPNSLPDFATFGGWSLLGAFQHLGVVAALLLLGTLLVTDLFENVGTITAVGAEAGLLDDEGVPREGTVVLAVGTLGAVAGGAAGVSSASAAPASVAGVVEGARTGLASVVTGGLFLVLVQTMPLFEIIPLEAVLPSLVLAGLVMVGRIREVDLDDVESALPALLTIALIPFTFSIVFGMAAGVVSYVLVKVCRRKAREVPALLWASAVVFVLYLALDPLTRWLTGSDGAGMVGAPWNS